MIASQAKPAMERAELESQLPVIGDPYDSRLQHPKIGEFLNPGKAFLKMLWQRLDTLSGGFTDTTTSTLRENSHIRGQLIQAQFADIILSAMRPYSSNPPDALLLSPTSKEVQAFATESEAIYNTLIEYGLDSPNVSDL